MRKKLIAMSCLFAANIDYIAADTTQKQPNIVVIVVDDLGYGDLSHTGISKDVSTPNIDALAEGGVRFTNAYATAPICNASRIAIMTGCYQQRQGQYWYSGPGLENPKYTTIAETLKKAGYATGYVGKFHHGRSDKPSGRGFPLNHGFDSFYGFSGGTKHYLHHSSSYEDRNLHEGPMYVGKEKKNVEGFTTELFGEQARSFIRTNKDKPFYLHLSFNAVHNFTHQLPESYLKEKGLKGFADNESKKTYWHWRQKIGYPAHPEGREYYLGQLYFLDREIGLVMRELSALGITDNTAVIFTSDNGGSLVTYANNGPLNGGKYTLFEGGNKVPFIIRYPKRSMADKVLHSMTSTMDLYPTICSFTGTEIPQHLDGKDISPILAGKESWAKRTLFWDTNAQQAVRRGKWKLLITHKAPNKKLQITATPTGEFLFDLEQDPGETDNLADQFPEVFGELKKELQSWRKSL